LITAYEAKIMRDRLCLLLGMPAESEN